MGSDFIAQLGYNVHEGSSFRYVLFGRTFIITRSELFSFSSNNNFTLSNNEDFIETSYRTEFFGKLPMTFMKNHGQVMGLITATIDGEVRKYVFNDKGYEPLEDLISFTRE